MNVGDIMAQTIELINAPIPIPTEIILNELCFKN